MWPKKPVHWIENGKVYVSVVFTWQVEDVLPGWVLGGPGAKLLGIDNGDYPGAIKKHNPDACFTTRGCIRKCGFCAVPILEGDFREIEKPELGPIVCDNNFLASSRKHFDRVIDGLKRFNDIDFNQGLDSRLMDEYKATRLAELDIGRIRLSWDYIDIEPFGAIYLLHNYAKIPKSKISVYVLIGFNDTPGEALYKLKTILERGYRPYPLRYQPLDARRKNDYIGPGWTSKEFYRFTQYWSRLRHYGSIPFNEFRVELRRMSSKGRTTLFQSVNAGSNPVVR